MQKTVWQPERTPPPAEERPKLLTTLGRGLRGLCPGCGLARMFAGYLRVVRACPACAAPLGNARADDAPPYFTLVAVGHIVVPLLLWTERTYEPALWLMASIFLPMTLVLALALLRPIKGATVGAMLSFGMIEPARDG